MGRIVHPAPPYFSSGIVTCPDCGRCYWGSSRCACGAALHGPRRKPHYLDLTVRRHWLIDHDGTARLINGEAPA